MREKKLIVKIIQEGQIKAYGDSRYEYEIEADGFYEFDVLNFCTKILKPCEQKRSEWSIKNLGGYFAGYYELEKIGDNKYHYLVFQPYCD